MNRAGTIVLAAGILVAAGCDESQNPSAPSEPATGTTLIYADRLAVQGSGFYSFRVAVAESVRIMLASLNAPGSHAAVSTGVGLGFGIPSGTDCGLISSMTTSAALAPQMSVAREPGIYCVRIADVGSLTGPLDFVIRIILPPEGATTPDSATETFASQLAVGGAVSRSFKASQPGTVSLTLREIGPPSTGVVGLGIGVPRADGTGCNLTHSLNTGAGSSPQISTGVYIGTYCVKVYDIGNLPDTTNFTITFVRP
jgi:hypothetical protein